jgi:hypothetical protein
LITKTQKKEKELEEVGGLVWVKLVEKVKKVKKGLSPLYNSHTFFYNSEKTNYGR